MPNLEREARARLVGAIRAGEDVPLSRQDTVYVTTWTGSKAELVATRICSGDQFPRAPKRLLWANEHHRAGVDSWETRFVAGSYYTHSVFWDADARADRDRDPSLHRCDGRVGAPMSAGVLVVYAEAVLEGDIKTLVRLMSGGMERDLHGSITVRYPPADVSRIQAALEHAVQLLQSSSPVRVVTEMDEKAAAAGEDDAFQRTLSRLVRGDRGQT